MKTVALICRLLLGVAFTVFGLNGFFHFLPQPPPPPVGGEYLGLLSKTHYLVPVFALQLVGGLLLLSGYFVPLALAMLGPVIVNILLYHTLMDLKGIPPAIIVLVLWLVVFYSVRGAFAGLFAARAPVDV